MMNEVEEAVAQLSMGEWHQLRMERLEGYKNITEAALRRGKRELDAAYRELTLRDLFFLMVFILGWDFANNDWWFKMSYIVSADPDGHLDIWAREHGKDLACDTPMLTANRGWTTHGGLVVGDTVFNPNGQPVKVLALSDRYTSNRCLKIEFQGGESIVCGEHHLWRVIDSKHGKRDKSGYRPTIRTERIVEAKDLLVKNNVGTLVCPIEPVGKDIVLPIDPYVLGVWLGDGTSSSAHITQSYGDIEVIYNVADRGYDIREALSSNKGSGNFHFGGGIRGKKGTGVTPILRAIGVLGNKHIPVIYKNASVEQRMELMRGLMDTDGTVNIRGNASFSNTNERLIDDVYEVATSLALRPRKIRKAGVFKGQEYISFGVDFQLHKDRNVFSLRRKAERAITPSQHRLCNSVTRITEVSSVPTSCIQVEGGMYVAGRDLVPTHNSSIITTAKTIQDILNDPLVMACILSFNRPTAKRFLRSIKTQFEMNKKLKDLFPDVLYKDPQKESPKWSEDEGIVVKRAMAMPHSTLEAYGVIDSMPTGGHYTLLIYDDVVTKEAVSSNEVIEKVTDSVSLSFNLSSINGGRMRMIGTRYHYNDTYQTMINRKAFNPRVFAATDDGKITGVPGLWDRDTLAKKVAMMGPSVAAAQLMCKPVLEGEEKFAIEWIQRWVPRNWDRMNRYILVDPANEKSKKSDWTVMCVFGLGDDKNYYLIDMIKDKLSLKERADRLISLHKQYRPLDVGYEKYGMQADTQYIKEKMDEYQYRFGITELGGGMAKNDRILSWLQPLFADKRVYLPDTLVKQTYDRRQIDVMIDFVQDEYLAFPFMVHDDMLDCMARINDPAFITRFPKEGVSKGGIGLTWAVDKKVEDFYDFDTFSGDGGKR